MLNCWQIGDQSFETYVKYHILKQPSTANAPVQCKRILTMKIKKPKKKRTSQKEKDSKQIIQCLRQQLAWSKHNSQSEITDDEMQYSLLPRALADEEGNPHKGSKSHWTNYIVAIELQHHLFLQILHRGHKY